MITINLFKDGAYAKGHDDIEVCSLVSYTIWAATEDCLHADLDVEYYQSANDLRWSDLGLSYFKFNIHEDEHVKIFENFKRNIVGWIDYIYPNRIKIIQQDDSISWDMALADAKREQDISQ